MKKLKLWKIRFSFNEFDDELGNHTHNVVVTAYSEEEAVYLLESYFKNNQQKRVYILGKRQIKLSTPEGKRYRCYLNEEYYDMQLLKCYHPSMYEPLSMGVKDTWNVTN